MIQERIHHDSLDVLGRHDALPIEEIIPCMTRKSPIIRIPRPDQGSGQALLSPLVDVVPTALYGLYDKAHMEAKPWEAGERARKEHSRL